MFNLLIYYITLAVLKLVSHNPPARDPLPLPSLGMWGEKICYWNNCTATEETVFVLYLPLSTMAPGSVLSQFFSVCPLPNMPYHLGDSNCPIQTLAEEQLLAPYIEHLAVCLVLLLSPSLSRHRVCCSLQDEGLPTLGQGWTR